MELSLQNNEISNDPETKGFSLSAGNTWIYPENYPIRQYQYNIVKSALYQNTLVCLPTGLGKTFIAAVVMYNFWRWYPFGKIVFLAPTKPLVAQQIDACYEVMGIPSVDMIELTGAVNQKNRVVAWCKKRIIFATPQVFHNDLEKAIVPSHLVKCVVVDEAHKALGKHSYCECIRILYTQNQYFRILALSATPGNKMDNVHEIIQNLRISHLELRDETSIDIMPYVNKRKVDIILVPLSHELAVFKDKYIVIMDRHVKFLMQCNILRAETANISKGRIFHLLKEFKEKTDKSGNYGQIMKTLNILLTMYHAYELMIRHGLRAFCKFYETHSDKFWMHNENQLKGLLHDIETYLGPFPDILPNGHVSEISADLVFGHNKFHKLKELLEHHFKCKNDDRQDTRAIVFVEYRDIVNEVYILLLKSKPVIRPQMFVGQASQKQKQQIKALEDFRSNRVNVLISTSIGEEGLDVGEVDLIICFDVSQHSPIRLVQRMGRTGRKRDGHIIVLVTDGKEHENLKSTLSKRDSLNNKILNTSNIFSSLYENNPRMIPSQFTPECYKMHIIAPPKTPNVKDKRKKKRNEKKEINKKNEIFTTKQKETSSIKKDTNQSSMMKFLTNSKCNEQSQNNTCNILTQSTTQCNNLQNMINPNNIKLLSDDNAGVDFLTLCAVKRSEEEISSKSVHKMDTTYIPIAQPVKDLFNFVLPDIAVIDCFFTSFKDISAAECKGCEDDVPTQNKNNEDENIHDNNDCIDIDDNNFWCTIRNENNIDNNEIRFEDILDESSDSSKTTISYLDKQIKDIEINSSNIKVSVSHTKDDNKAMIDIGVEVPNNTAGLESSLFENILNESFSSIEDHLEKEDMSRQNTVSSNSPNVFSNVKKNNVTDENTVNTLHDKDNTKSDSNLSLFMEPAKPNQINKFIDEIQDFDFNSDDDINEFVRHESSRNKSKHNSKAEESMLSITQAINDIAKIKKDLKISPKSSICKEESINENSTGWISVNTKNEIKIKKRNTSSRIEKKISNLCNSTAKSGATKQDFYFPDDSDEDFMITEDNAKKFNELESCYFRDMSKNWEDKSSCLPSTSRNSENKTNYFDNTSKHSEAKSYSDNMSKNMKPRGTSTPTNNRRAGLSLKRNKVQYLDNNKIDLSLFEASSRYMNNTKNKSTLESSSPKQMVSLDETIAQKIRHEHKRRNNVKNEFIDDEAEVDSDASSDETIIVDEDDLADFVSYTQYQQDEVDMQAHYLQTIKSPIKQPGAFHFRKPRSPDLNTEIYSQPLSQEQDSYLYDSFCVREDIEPSILVNNDTILERAERELKRNRRRRLCLDKKTRNVKRQKTNHSESSEDEIEQLRIQVQED
ncbi:Fanconi anemia group M protein isoform X1 [Formica exsecta]|uniref:Fanconi anemia group M protein isoform X1 n=1 Tax=Formica exsecta TaxID=72781 RepID=UPI00114334EA|nr:Fanconi anemia group M protein isoform X1 [Formica exsecta]